MSELARGKVDGQPIHVGDQVLVRATVRRSVAGVGALVRFSSKTENHEGWVAEDDKVYFVVDQPEAGDPSA